MFVDMFFMVQYCPYNRCCSSDRIIKQVNNRKKKKKKNLNPRARQGSDIMSSH